MSINHVQFQKGLSMAEFMERYGTEAKCHAALVASRWPEGFRCPCCGDERHSTFVREERQHWQCHRCRRQSTVTAGTVFEATKLPLTRWFLALQLLTQAKNNVSALELRRQLGVCYRTAWRHWAVSCSSTTPIWAASATAASRGGARKTSNRSPLP